MNLRQRIRFYQQLAVLTRGGVPLRTGLQRLRERLHGRQIDLLAEKVAAGEPLGEAFAAARFSPFETNLAAAGSGARSSTPCFSISPISGRGSGRCTRRSPASSIIR